MKLLSNTLLRMALSLCFVGLLGSMANAQQLPNIEAPQAQKGSVYVNGEAIPTEGHNNLSKLLRMQQAQQAQQAARQTTVSGGPVKQMPNPGLENPQDRDAYELMMLRDPRTGEIPANIRKKELAYAQTLLGNQGGGIQGLSIGDDHEWKRRGPYNVGGRTRALAIDASNTNRILAGGVSGGMWLSADGGATWNKTTETTELQSVTCLAQDPRDGFEHVWYYGTGEIRGNSAGGGGAPFRGNGVFKSTDGGLSWSLLESTASNTPHIFDPGFDYVHNITVDPTSGDVWAAAYGNVFQSTDGGASWDTVATTNATWTDVAITSTGDVYITLEAEGIFRKGANDTTFADITPDFVSAGALGRTVLGIAPSDEDQVYFMAYTPSAGVLGHMILKYTYDENDTTAQQGTFEDRSANVPAFGGSVGNFNSQGAYDLLIKVHPTNPDMVFVGGTNIYRSSDGFASDSTTYWIGGYATLNNVSIYPNQHPDQHVLVFYPDNPDRALSGNDGGVQLAEDITQADEDDTPVDWISLNNGYYTTQPYAISIDPTAEVPDMMMAGFQDNGTWITNSEADTSTWLEEFGGDGSFNAIADGGRTRLVSSQNGNLYVFYYSDPNDLTSFAGWTRIVPAGASGFSFVNPFILDPNDDNVLYVATSNGVWRNSDYTAIPLFNGGTTSVNWSLIPGTDAAAGPVTTLEASTFEPNILYFGTSFGEVYRVEDAHSGNPTVVDVWSDSPLPGGSVSSIAVDPADADRVLLTFSNYNVRSVWYSEDGGDNWIDVSGNLETSADGVGAGPSVRWVEMLTTDSTTYFLAGTSTGLYSTEALGLDSLNETEWELESADLIGNAVIRHMAVRPYDGTIAVATHANGMYSTQIPVEPVDRIFAGKLDNVSVFEGTPKIVVEADFDELFIDEGDDNEPLEIFVYSNTNEELVEVDLDAEDGFITFYFTEGEVGSAGIVLAATSEGRFAFSSFDVTVESLPEPALFNQVQGPGSGITAQLFTDLGGPVITVDDFAVPEGVTWEVASITAPGTKNSLPIEEVVLSIFSKGADSLGLPDTILYTDTLFSSNGPDNATITLELNDSLPLTLTEGEYWLNIMPIMPFAGNAGRWFWSRQATGFGSEYYLADPADLFRAGFLDFTPAAIVSSSTLRQLSFRLDGATDEEFVAPDAPAALDVEALSPIEAGLGWTTVEGAVAYEIYRGISTDSLGLAYTVPAESDSLQFITDLGLEPDTWYFYAIKVLDVNGSESEFTEDSVLTYPDVPAVWPATDITSSSFTANWEEVSSDEYWFQLSEDYDFNDSTLILDTALDSELGNAYAVTGVDAGTEYFYRVAAANETGAFDWSEAEWVLTTPSAIDGLSLTSVTNNTVSYSWLTDEEEEIDGYKVYRGLSADSLAMIASMDVADDSLQTFTDSVSSNTWYWYAFKAYNDGGASDAVTDSALSLPNLPTAETASAVSNVSFQANWSAVSTGSYHLQVGTTDTFDSLLVDADLADTVTSYVLGGLTPATTFYYRVKAMNTSGSLGYSNTVMVQTTVTAPTLFAHDAVQDSAVILWDSVPGVTDYVFDFSGSDDFSSGLVDAGVDFTGVLITGLTANTTYYIRVRSVGVEDTSANSATYSFTTLPNIPNAPTGLAVARDGSNVMQVSWSLDAGDVVDYQILERSEQETTGFTQLDSIAGDVTTYSDADVEASIRYYYRVKAVNTGGESDFTTAVADLLTGLDEVLSAGAKVWPNPASKEATLTLNHTYTGEITVKVINQAGQVIQEEVLTKDREVLETTINMEGLAKGLYMVHIATQKGFTVKTIIKQ